MKITASVKYAVQFSPDDWQTRTVSKIFPDSTSIAVVIIWARKFVREADICDIGFSVLDEKEV